MIIAYDLGTGGVKASLYDEGLQTIAKSFIEYPTYYPGPGRHEQRPEDWWNGVVQSTKNLLSQSGVEASSIQCLALSGHSLVTVPIGSDGALLAEQVPIWSDTRADVQAKRFFETIDEEAWYNATGNGFPAACYSLFKLMWLKDNQPELYSKVDKVLGSKDYINYCLTDEYAMDHSYASGTGCYNLFEHKFDEALLSAAGIAPEIFPEISTSHQIIGTITQRAAAEIGLPQGTPIACGGVDNACMALGAVGAKEGRVYTSLGSSSWIPVNSAKPVLDFAKKPYVFAHIEEDMYTSAFSIFAGGSSLRWVRETLYFDIDDESTVYDQLSSRASEVPIGANGLIFNPSLAGGTSQDKSPNIKGSWLGLHLGTGRDDMLRAAMEGITMNLKMSYDFLKTHADLDDELMICGGGSKSPFWLQMFADVFGIDILKTNVDQDAASLGAAAIAARAINLWEDYTPLDQLIHVEKRYFTEHTNNAEYQRIQPVFEKATEMLADLGDEMTQVFGLAE